MSPTQVSSARKIMSHFLRKPSVGICLVLPEPSGLVIKFRSKCFNQYSNPFEEFKKLILKLSKNDVRLKDYDTSLATIY